MPTPIKKHRTYCKTCKDFTLHKWVTNKDLACEVCETIETGYKISEVDPNLIKAQRERYKQSKSRKFRNTYASFLNGYGIEAMLSSLEDAPQIIECDAGEKEIEERRKQLRLKIIEDKRKLKEEFEESFKDLGRNDKCSCGSGKKFKHCHLLIFREKGMKF